MTVARAVRLARAFEDLADSVIHDVVLPLDGSVSIDPKDARYIARCLEQGARSSLDLDIEHADQIEAAVRRLNDERDRLASERARIAGLLASVGDIKSRMEAERLSLHRRFFWIVVVSVLASPVLSALGVGL